MKNPFFRTQLSVSKNRSKKTARSPADSSQSARPPTNFAGESSRTMASHRSGETAAVHVRQHRHCGSTAEAGRDRRGTAGLRQEQRAAVFKISRRNYRSSVHTAPVSGRSRTRGSRSPTARIHYGRRGTHGGATRQAGSASKKLTTGQLSAAADKTGDSGGTDWIAGQIYKGQRTREEIMYKNATQTSGAVEESSSS